MFDLFEWMILNRINRIHYIKNRGTSWEFWDGVKTKFNDEKIIISPGDDMYALYENMCALYEIQGFKNFLCSTARHCPPSDAEGGNWSFFLK